MSARARHRPWFAGVPADSYEWAASPEDALRWDWQRRGTAATLLGEATTGALSPDLWVDYSRSVWEQFTWEQLMWEHEPRRAQPVHLMFACDACWTHGEELSYGGLGPYACDLCGRVVARERGHFPSHGHALRRGRDSRGARL